jgi:hypothetical protein
VHLGGLWWPECGQRQVSTPSSTCEEGLLPPTTPAKECGEWWILLGVRVGYGSERNVSEAESY